MIETHRRLLATVALFMLPSSIAVDSSGSVGGGVSSAGSIGDPIIAKRIDIGDAPSIPMVGGFETVPTYDRGRLARDLLKLLDAEPSPIVRTESIRRAAIYATNFDNAVEPSPAQIRLSSHVVRQLADRVIERKMLGLDATRELFDYAVLCEYARARYSSSVEESRWTVAVGDAMADDTEIQIVAAWLQLYAPEGRPHRFCARVAALPETARSVAALASMEAGSPTFRDLLQKARAETRPRAESRGGK